MRWDLKNEEDLKKIEKRIQASFFRITKGNEDPSDCVQEILLRMLEGRHKHATIDQCVVDYLRMQSGRKGSVSYSTRINLNNSDSLEPGKNDQPIELGPRRESSDRDLHWFVNELRGSREGDMMSMQLEGYSLKEIGSVYGFSESRASQLLKAAVEKSQILILLNLNVREWASKYVF